MGCPVSQSAAVSLFEGVDRRSGWKALGNGRCSSGKQPGYRETWKIRLHYRDSERTDFSDRMELSFAPMNSHPLGFTGKWN